jgi:hypothetical protein
LYLLLLSLGRAEVDWSGASFPVVLVRHPAVSERDLMAAHAVVPPSSS